MTKKEQLVKVMFQSLDQVIDYVEDEGISVGTSVSVGVSQIEINGAWYEIQLRLEGHQPSYIGGQAVVLSQQVGDTKTMS